MSRVRVRPLRPHEGKKLVALLRHSRDAIAVRRAEIILRSAQGERPDAIAAGLHFSADYVRKVIHRFNDDGLASLKAQYANGGRPKTVQPEHESSLIELAMTPPRLTGLPFTHWSLEKLRQAAIARRLIPQLSLETVRQILRAHHLSLQRTKTWKQSDDPQFEVKKTPSNGCTARPNAAAKR
jgi:transposase